MARWPSPEGDPVASAALDAHKAAGDAHAVVLAAKATVASVTQEAAERVAAVQAEADARILALTAKADVVALGAHEDALNNPHAVSKGQVGLPNAENTSDAAKNSAVATLSSKTIDGARFVDGQNNKIKIRRGISAALPAGGTEAGEFRYSSDTKELYVDDGSENVRVGSEVATGGINPAQQAALNATGYRAGWRHGKASTMHRDFVWIDNNAGAAATSILQLVALTSPLLAGESYSAISFRAAGNFSSPTRQWFCLVRRSDMTVLRSTVDDTTAAWNNGEKQLALSAPYVPAVTEEAYVGLYVVAAGLPPMRGINMLNTERVLPPALGGRSSTLSDSGPLADGTVVGALSAVGHGQVFRAVVY